MKETGWIQNAWGIKYLGGGTCHFWIANRMILATAAFQGMPYPIGSVCGRDIAFAPAVPANVTETAPLYPNSDPSMAQTATWRATAPAYAGYIPSGFLLPRGTNDNRAIAAGSEKLTASTGQKGRVFLVGPRPGMTYSVGTTFEAALQIDPIVPVNIIFKLFYPDGRTDQTSGFSDAFGSFSGTVKFLLDVPGIYQYTINANWNGYPAFMPGLPPTGGELCVLEAQPPANATGIQITTADGTKFDPVAGIHIIGRSTADQVHCTVVMPGAVLDQGDLPVNNGQFDYYFNPADLHSRAQTYDIANRTTGKPEFGDVVHLSLFSQETTADGQVYHSFTRVIVRGNRVRVAK